MEKLFEFLASIRDKLIFWTILDEYEEGVIFTLGRLRRKEYVIGPGLHLVWPFGIEGVISYNMGINAAQLKRQDLTTADGVAVTVNAAIIWKNHDVETLAIKVQDDENIIDTHVATLVAETVRASAWDDMSKTEWHEALNKAARKAGFKYGIEVLDMSFVDLQRLDFTGRIAQ